jgi:hypothetical protein
VEDSHRGRDRHGIRAIPGPIFPPRSFPHIIVSLPPGPQAEKRPPGRRRPAAARVQIARRPEGRPRADGSNPGSAAPLHPRNDARKLLTKGVKRERMPAGWCRPPPHSISIDPSGALLHQTPPRTPTPADRRGPRERGCTNNHQSAASRCACAQVRLRVDAPPRREVQRRGVRTAESTRWEKRIVGKAAFDDPCGIERRGGS